MYEIIATIDHPKYGPTDIVAECDVDSPGSEAYTSGPSADHWCDVEPAEFSRGDAWYNDEDVPELMGDDVAAKLMTEDVWTEIEADALEIYKGN